MRVIRRDPDKGYLERHLWVPKRYIDVNSVKSALTYEIASAYGDSRVRLLYLWKETAHHLLVPRAFWDPARLPCAVVDCRPQTYQHVDFKSRIRLDHRLKEVEGKKLLMPTGGDLQQRSLEALEAAPGGVLQLACGKGKTVVALEKIARGRVPALVLLDNTNLLYQWQQEAEALLDIPGGIGIYGDGKKDWRKSLVLATYHSVANWSETIPEEARRWFGQIFWDEGHHCFPAGTRVGGQPIESIEVGSIVHAYNHDTRRVERRRVLHKHISRVQALVRIRLDGGKVHICTPEHPFFTKRGYVAAKDLQVSDAVATVAHRPEACCAGWARETSERTLAAASTAPELGTSVRGQNVCEKGFGPLDALQGGHCKPREEGSNRGRRELTQVTQGEGVGPEEDWLLDFHRVDSVEVLEPGSGGTFGGVCQNGLVYNLEVEGLENYFVEGTLVHNCPAPIFSKTADMFYGARYSLTATPERDDGLHVLSDGHIGPILLKDLTPTMQPSFGFLWTGLRVDTRDPIVASKVLDINGEVHLSKLYSYFGQWQDRVNLLLKTIYEAEQAGRMVLVLSNSVDEVVNLANCWERPGFMAYTDIPTPTPADVGEQLNPLLLTRKDVDKIERRLTTLRAQLNKAVGKDIPIIQADIGHQIQLLKQHDIGRKIQNELERRQRAYINELVTTSTKVGILTYEVPPQTRRKFLAERNIIFAITKYGKEGMDCPRLDTVILSALFSTRNGLQQLMGRPTRPMPGKKQPVLLALVDDIGQCIGMSKKLINHLRTWPIEEGGPYEPILIGFPASWRTKTTTIKTTANLFGQ